MSYKCKVPILLIFFNRPETFIKVFEKVREVKPETLILAQDGPRSADDVGAILACRKIAENIDWECDVTKLYSDFNLGCGRRPQKAITEALKEHQEVIILEDDCVPSKSFFPYCEELLKKYKDDERIAYISGLNHFETWDCGESDYFFSKAGAIWGWATWRRSWEKYDYFVRNINDKYILKLYKQQVADKYVYKSRLDALLKANRSETTKEKLSYWDTQWGFAEYTQNMLVVVPKRNLICNIGVGESSTHAKNLKTSKYVKYKNMVFMPTYEIEFPLKHASFCAPDMDYHNLVYKCSRQSWVNRIINKVLKVIGLKK